MVDSFNQSPPNWEGKHIHPFLPFFAKQYNIETIENGNIENERAEPCMDCDTRSKLDSCKNGCELLVKSWPVFQWMDIDCLHPDPSQPRKTFDGESLKGLAETIKTQGLLQPLVVDENGRIVIGERRWRAAKEAGIKTIPAIIRTPESDSARLAYQAIADAQSKHLHILERAKAWGELKEKMNLSNPGLARLLGKSKMYVGQVLSLINMPKPMVRALEEGKITPSELADIRALPEEDQLEVLEQSIEKQKTRDEIRGMIKKRRHKLISNLDRPGKKTYNDYLARPKDVFRQFGIDNVHQNVVVASNHETTKHFVVKALIYKILRAMGRITMCEMEAGTGVVDLFDTHTGFAYEIESNPGPNTGREKMKQFACRVKDVLIINLNKVPDDLVSMETYLKEYVV